MISASVSKAAAANRLCLQGFPLHPKAWPQSVKVTSFQTLPLEARNPRSVGGQAGNSMNLAVLQITQLHSYMCLVPRQIPSLLSLMPSFHANREQQRKMQQQCRRRLRSKTPARLTAWPKAEATSTSSVVKDGAKRRRKTQWEVRGGERWEARHFADASECWALSMLSWLAFLSVGILVQ